MKRKTRKGTALKLKRKVLRALEGADLAKAQGGTDDGGGYGNWSGDISGAVSGPRDPDAVESDACYGSFARGTGYNHNQALRR